MNSLFQIDIPKRSSTCVQGRERLVPGMEYYSLIVSDDDQKIIRRDFCLACWSTFSDKDLTDGQTYWKSRIENKKESYANRSASKVARALELLKNALLEPHPNEVEVFVLALFLARHRCLILRQEFEREGNTYFLYELAHQDEFLTIKKMTPSPSEIEAIQRSLSNQLNTSHSSSD